MAQFLRSVLIQDASLAASTTRDPDDLPVNPLSHILITLRALNNTATIGNYRYLQELLSFISTVRVIFRGQSIIEGSLRDLALLNILLTGHRPVQSNAIKTDNDVRMVTVLLSFSRVPYWADEAFPAVRKGELQLQFVSGAAPTGFDTLILQVETVELLDARPTRFLKYTTISKTPSATGDHDVEIPIGNKILDILMFGTTTPTGGVYTASIGTARLLVDNVEMGYANANWETLHGELGRRVGSLADLMGHTHSFADTATVQESDTKEQALVENWLENYALLDYDPLRDGQHAIDTRNRARVHLRISADFADAIRVIPVELIELAAPAGA